MSGEGDFRVAFAATVRAAGIRHRTHTPESLSALWSRFADACAGSFQGTLEEYYGLLGVRSVIQQVMCGGELIGFPEMVDFVAAVSRADVAFRSCLDVRRRADVERAALADGHAWYWQYFPAYAGADLVRDLQVHYGHRATVRPATGA